MEHHAVQPLFGEGQVQGVTEVFDELGIAIEALESQADLLTNEDHWSDRDAGDIVGQGTQLAITVERLRELLALGFHLAVKAKQPTETVS